MIWIYLEETWKTWLKDEKIRDLLSLTPDMKPENAEWLKQVLTFQADLEVQAGPSRRPVAADSDDSL